MKYIIMIISLMLIGCGENDSKNALSGYYSNGSGTINNESILSIYIEDKFETIDIMFETETQTYNCKYSFFEQVENDFYFVTIPQESLLILSFRKRDGKFNFKTLNEPDLLNNCSNVDIVLAFVQN